MLGALFAKRYLAALCAPLALALGGCAQAQEAEAPPPPAPHVPLDPFAEDADFFPVGAYLQSPDSVDEWRALGVNMIVSSKSLLTLDDIERYQSSGMLLGADDRQILPWDELAELAVFAKAADEPDNMQALPGGGFGPCVSAEAQREEAEALRKRTGLPVLRNFGRGLADPAWLGRGDCGSLRDDYYPASIASADLVAFDVYPVASYDGQLELMARGSRNLQRFIKLSGADRPQWAFIEAAAIFGGAVPQRSQLRALTWMAVTNGARGIVLFPWEVAQTGERVRSDATFSNPQLTADLRDVIGELQSLSAVLKAGERTPVVMRSGPSMSTLALRHERGLYLFAVSESPNARDVELQVQQPLDGRAEVLGEGRSVTIADGRIAERFEGYDVNLYHIADVFPPGDGA